MRKVWWIAVLAPAALALAGCNKGGSAHEEAQPDNVEMPAEEAVGDVDASAAPQPEAAITEDAAAVSAPAPAASAAPRP